MNIIAEIKSYFEAYKKHFETLKLKDLGLDALEGLAFAIIEQLEIVAKLTDTKLDDEVIEKLKEWADKINPKKNRHGEPEVTEPTKPVDDGSGADDNKIDPA